LRGADRGDAGVTSSTGALKYRCKVSGKNVETSIQTDDLTLLAMDRMKLSVWCPHCKDSHSIMASEAYVGQMSSWKAA
jgi:transposase-like protein